MKKENKNASAVKRAAEEENDRRIIRKLLALPPEKRMNFLRMRLKGGGSAV